MDETTGRGRVWVVGPAWKCITTVACCPQRDFQPRESVVWGGWRCPGHPSRLQPAAQTTGLGVAMATPACRPHHLLSPNPDCSTPSINKLIMYDNSYRKHPGSSPLENKQPHPGS
ncbi:hypothetical protein H1C71_015471 [Ictidomys tridecemlineatus]|nr:hypothetical protein H1C71_015471 [Ictidomys tridecemlineatus]